MHSLATYKMRSAIRSAIAIAVLCELVSSGQAAPPFLIRNIGLTGADQTLNDGRKISIPGSAVATFDFVNTSGTVTGYSVGEMGFTAWVFDGMATTVIGLIDAAHTGVDGKRHSYATSLNDAGQVIGWSYQNGWPGSGVSAWLFDGVQTLNLTLSDAEHTDANGNKSSSATQLNASGQVIGGSARFNGGTDYLGETAWFYDGNATITLGFTGPLYQSDQGLQTSIATSLSDAGHVLGYSEIYDGGSDFLGAAWWLYKGATTIKLGLHDSDHPYENTYVQQLSETGQVIGESPRIPGGESAWLYDGATTIQIGLVDAEHTRLDGYKNARALKINSSGQVAGASGRFNGGILSLGQSTWLYDGTSTLMIGLVDAEYTRNDGFRHNEVYRLNDAGQAIGRANRFSGSSLELGRTAWLYNGVTTIKLGLADAEHTRIDGFKYSDFASGALNEAGQVIGYSQRYNESNSDLGRSAWLYDGTTIIKLGFDDVAHTRNDGFRFSDFSAVDSLNEAGQVIGYSRRYSGMNSSGQDAWVYSPLLGTAVSLQLSMRTDGFAFSVATYLGEDGVVLGYYNLYDGATFVGERALYWSEKFGLHDLGQLVEHGLDAQGWSALYRSLQTDGHGRIIGYGIAKGLVDGSQSVFVLTPVPEPQSSLIAIVGFALSMLACRHLSLGEHAN